MKKIKWILAFFVLVVLALFLMKFVLDDPRERKMMQSAYTEESE